MSTTRVPCAAPIPPSYAPLPTIALPEDAARPLEGVRLRRPRWVGHRAAARVCAAGAGGLQRLQGLPALGGAGPRGAREGGKRRVDAATRTLLARLRLLSIEAVRKLRVSELARGVGIVPS